MGLKTSNGHGIGVHLFNKTHRTCIDKTKVHGLMAGTKVDGLWLGTSYYGDQVEYNANYPNKVPYAAGIKIATDSNDSWIGKTKIDALEAAGCEVPIWTW